MTDEEETEGGPRDGVVQVGVVKDDVGLRRGPTNESAQEATRDGLTPCRDVVLTDFPPSSRVTFLRLEVAAAFMTCRPTRVDPVNATLRIFWCDAIAFPTVSP